VEHSRVTPAILQSVLELKAANDNLVSETTALKRQLKAANDNEARMEQRIERLERKWAKP
jgi:outer membrane murein-binding lipoprotein Lpp